MASRKGPLADGGERACWLKRPCLPGMEQKGVEEKEEKKEKEKGSRWIAGKLIRRQERVPVKWLTKTDRGISQESKLGKKKRGERAL